jgi:cell wall-associated NlpC family hydrolase
MRFPIAAVGAGSSREDRFSFVEVHALRFAAPSFRLAGDTGGGGGTGGTGGGYSDPVVSGGIDQAESQEVERNAVTIAQDYDNRGVTYSSGGDASDGGSTSDCSHFVNDVLQQAGVDVPYTTTAGMANSPNFQEVEEADARPGDVIVQGNHMGIYTGTDPEGVVQGVQMGNHGAQTAPWGPGGWFSNAGDLRFYRPVPGKE